MNHDTPTHTAQDAGQTFVLQRLSDGWFLAPGGKHTSTPRLATKLDAEDLTEWLGAWHGHKAVSADVAIEIEDEPAGPASAQQADYNVRFLGSNFPVKASSPEEAAKKAVDMCERGKSGIRLYGTDRCATTFTAYDPGSSAGVIVTGPLMTASAPQAHTPGKWKLNRNAAGQIWIQEGSGFIAEMTPLFGDVPESLRAAQMANATLIAAAPEMLAACQSFTAMYRNGIVGTDLDAAYHAMTAAIAHATQPAR